jgi:hypothetical protein
VILTEDLLKTVLCWEYIVALQKFSQSINYIMVNSPPHHSLLSPLPQLKILQPKENSLSLTFLPGYVCWRHQNSHFETLSFLEKLSFIDLSNWEDEVENKLSVARSHQVQVMVMPPTRMQFTSLVLLL